MLMVGIQLVVANRAPACAGRRAPLHAAAGPGTELRSCQGHGAPAAPHQREVGTHIHTHIYIYLYICLYRYTLMHAYKFTNALAK